MAEALLRHHLAAAGVDAHVHSAGLLEGGVPATPDGVAVMADYGLDTSTHISRTVTEEMLEADLIICMAREHLREAVLLHPPSWRRAFTLKELVRRGELSGGRQPDESLEDWLMHLQQDRSRQDLLGSSSADDVADPIGQGRATYQRTANELDSLIGVLVGLAWPTPDRWESTG
jgi:protein-tyrosine phosphatase